MKVSKCTQVFSHTVAAAINVLAFSGRLLYLLIFCVCLTFLLQILGTAVNILTMVKSAVDTAILLEFLDQLFHSLNGSSFNPTPGKTLRTGVTQGYQHIYFWNMAIEKLRSFRYVRDGKFFIPPSVIIRKLALVCAFN